MDDRDVEAWRKQMQQDSQSSSKPSVSQETKESSNQASAHAAGAQNAEESSIDPATKKSDLLLNEIAIMCQMCHHYTSSLLSSRLAPSLEDPETGKMFKELSAVAQQLVGELIILESIFMARNIKVASATVEPVPMDEDENIFCSSIVEELFYIVKKSFRRSIQSLNANAAAAIINQIVAAVDHNVGPERFIRAFNGWCVGTDSLRGRHTARLIPLRVS